MKNDIFNVLGKQLYKGDELWVATYIVDTLDHHQPAIVGIYKDMKGVKRAQIFHPREFHLPRKS